MASYIYTLFSARLSSSLDELWYVGRTLNICERFTRHQKGLGAKCLSGRSNIVMVRLEKETPFLELVRTLELMQKHGPHKVRGGPFVKMEHSSEDLSMIRELLDSEDFGRSPVEAPVKRPHEDDIIGQIDIVDRHDKQVERPTKLPKQGTRWTPQDLNLLETCVYEMPRKSMAEIQQMFQRSEGGIHAKARDILHKKLVNSSYETLAVELQISTEDLVNFFSSDKPIFA